MVLTATGVSRLTIRGRVNAIGVGGPALLERLPATALCSALPQAVI
jgi:hypothetical protein